MATIQPPTTKTSSSHSSTFVRGAHQFDIIGYSKLKSLGVRNTIRSVDFEAGGCTWALVCCFDVPAPASNPQQCQLVSISLELVSSDNYNYNSVIAKASLRIDDPTPPSSSGNKRCRRWPPAVWQSAEAHTYPATNYGGDDSDARSWKLSVPDAFREPLYVKDDRLTIHCTVVVLLQEDAETTSAARSCSVSVVPPPAISRDLRRLLHLDGSKSNSSGMPFATDVTFIVEQTEIHAHRLVLAMRSPVFNAGLLGAMKESAACSRVTIDDMSASTFKAMLFFIYTDELPNSHKYENQNVGDLLVAADRYDLERLRLMCEKILAENMDAESAMPTLMLVHGRERCRLLEASCIEYMASDPDVHAAVLATKEYKELKDKCGPFVTDVLEKVSVRALASRTCMTTSAAAAPPPHPPFCSKQIGPQKSASMFNSSEVFDGTHEFRIPDFTAMQKIHGAGECIESGIFHIGGYEWVVCVYPSGYDGLGFIGMRLHMLNPPVTTTGWVTATFRIDDPSGKTPPVIAWAESLYAQGTCLVVKKFMDVTTAKLYYVKYDGSLTIHCNVKVGKGFSYATSAAAAAAVGATTTIIAPPSNIACHLERLLVCQQYFDVKFLVKDSEVCAHQLVIAARSPVLHKAVSSAPDKDHVRIDDMDVPTFHAMLHFIYADELPLMMGYRAGDATTITRDLLVAADRFGLDRLKAMCENMLCQWATPENIVATLDLADRLHCQALNEFCLEHISQPHVLKEVVETKSFKDLKAASPPAF